MSQGLAGQGQRGDGDIGLLRQVGGASGNSQVLRRAARRDVERSASRRGGKRNRQQAGVVACTADRDSERTTVAEVARNAQGESVAARFEDQQLAREGAVVLAVV